VRVGPSLRAVELFWRVAKFGFASTAAPCVEHITRAGVDADALMRRALATRRHAAVSVLLAGGVDPDIREAFAGSVSGPFLPGGWYRNQFWFLPREHGDVLLCLGIYGQMLYVSPGTGTVVAKLSSWPDAQSPTMLHDTLLAFDAMGALLAGLPPEDPARRHRPPGIAAGLSRGRAGGPYR